MSPDLLELYFRICMKDNRRATLNFQADEDSEPGSNSHRAKVYKGTSSLLRTIVLSFNYLGEIVNFNNDET